MLLLTQDDEFINEREKKKVTEKPKNVIEGFGYGLSSMANGFLKELLMFLLNLLKELRKIPLKDLERDFFKDLVVLLLNLFLEFLI